jgi:hypothetical protein
MTCIQVLDVARAISLTLNSLHNFTTSKGPLQKLIEWPGLGSIRRYRDTSFEISSGPRSVPSSFLQEHAGNCTSHQWLEVGAGSEIPRERSGAQGGCPNATVCWWYWPCCAGYVASDCPWNGSQEVLIFVSVYRQTVRCFSSTLAGEVGRVPSWSPQECGGKRGY